MGLLQWLKGFFAPRRPVPQTTTEPTRAPLPEATAGASPFPPGTAPARLVVMRHAEKSGDKRDPHLNLPGRRRAEALVEYIPATFGTPEFLLAARTSLKSRRPVETLEPFSAALRLEIRSKFDDGESASLIAHLSEKKRYRGKLGVICWRHSDLPRLLKSLGAPPGTFPEPWPEDDYTTILDLTYTGNGAVHVRRVQMDM